MGYSAAGACHPTTEAAYAAFCASVEPGSNATSCGSCDAVAGTCEITLLSSSGVPVTASVPVATPPCDVPTPAQDASAYGVAILGLWLAVWGARQVYNLFRGGHGDF